MCVSGGKATFTIVGFTITGRSSSMGDYSETGTPIDDTVLGSVAMEYCPGDTVDYGTLEVGFSFDTLSKADWLSTAMQVNAPPVVGTVGLKNGTTITGTGFWTSRTLTPIERGTRIEASYVWQWDGKTPPVLA